MAALFTFFAVLILSQIIVRIGTLLLRITGLSADAAKFQVRSAFTGTGFTTRESEMIANHPIRRKIIMALMVMRNAGFISLISTLTISFVSTETNEEILFRAIILGSGLLFLILISRLHFLDKFFTMILHGLARFIKPLRVADYENLLNLSGEYEIIEHKCTSTSWLINKKLTELKLTDEGLLILGIKREDGHFIGTPQGETYIFPDDRVILYGREEILREIAMRKLGPEGDQQHSVQVKKHKLLIGKRKEKESFLKKARKKIFS